MASDFSVYCIKSVSSPPQALSRRKESGEFYCHIDVPVPEQLVVFSEGAWEDRKDFDVILRYKDDEVQLGHISRSNSCLCWRRDSSLPASMVSEAEKGLAKLVLEYSTGPPVLVKMTGEQATNQSLTAEGDATLQETDETGNVGKGKKNKRRSSIGKDDKAVGGPGPKKQKLQITKTGTRVRTPKSDSQENKISGKKDKTEETATGDVITEKKGRKGSKADGSVGNKEETMSEKVKKDTKASAKDEDKTDVITTGNVGSEKKGRKGSKADMKGDNKEETSEKVKKDTKVSAKDEEKDKKVKKEKTSVKPDKPDTDAVKEKKGRKDSKTDIKASPNEPQNEKKKRKGSKTDVKSNLPVNTENVENIKASQTVKTKLPLKTDNDENTKDLGTEGPAVVDNSGSQPRKRGRKSKNEKALEESFEREKCDKENVDINLPSPLVEAHKQKLATSNTDSTQHVTNEQTETSQDFGKKKMAVCKDLTSRALARPTGRWGHSLCFVHRNMSVLVGGQGEKQQLNKDSVWTLDTETRRWKSIATQSEGQKPEYRMGHTATYDPMVRCIYVFGGSKNTRWFHDVHVLDVDEWKWQLVKVNGKAPTRAYHSATLYRHELWIFGGVYPRPDPQPDGCSNDIHIFSPVMESWYSPIVKGEKPIPRSGHSATLLNDQLVVFGGWDAPISYSDLHILDMSIVEWSQPDFKGSPPSPRSWHASCALTGNRLLIHGGYNGDVALDDTHIFNIDNMSWCQIQVESMPTARVGHRALCMPYRHDNEEEDEVIIFGGGDNDGEYFDDLMSVYVPFDPVPLTAS